tara:strand:+ start:1213 stop:2211 length:999 start_codon:yes stop_codon:yes gene_type:complete
MEKDNMLEADSKVNTLSNLKFPKEIKWNDENEKILKNWADKGLCFKTMHDRSAKKYWCLNAWFSIPVIIISTLAGSGNFAQSSFKPAYSEMLILVIASSNIFCAILSTIAQYIGVAGLHEGHRFSALSWDKYARSIQVELAKNRSERRDASTFISKAEEDFNRLMEISPPFGNDIISWFNHLIDTGDFDESKKYMCGPCCYEWFCFPCGCKGCLNPKCVEYKCCGSTCYKFDFDHDSDIESDSESSEEFASKRIKNDNEKVDQYMKNKNYIKAWKYLDLPDILGRMKPTLIADPSKDPGRIKEETKPVQTVDENRATSIERPEDKYRILNEV